MTDDGIDHRALLARLSAATRRDLTRLADAPGLVRLSVHLGLLAGAALWVAAGWPGWGVALVAEGVLLAFLFALEHETIHRTAFRTGWLNDAAAHLAGLLLFLPPTWFRHYHLAHHRFTHDPENDPELESPKPRSWPGYVAHLSGLPDLAMRLRTLAANAWRGTEAAFVPPRARGRVRTEARAFLAAYALLATATLAAGSATLVWIWLLPLLIGGPFLRAFLLAEHARCPHVADMLRNTRTTFTNRLVRLLAWNMSYHAEHHAYPAVPFHKLPDLHRLARPHLGVTERSYLGFNARYLGDAAAGTLAREEAA